MIELILKEYRKEKGGGIQQKNIEKVTVKREGARKRERDTTLKKRIQIDGLTDGRTGRLKISPGRLPLRRTLER